MTLWRIALKNFWQNRNRYVAYVTSASFSVMIYFLYTALVLHPQLQGGYRGAIQAVTGMKAAAVVIAVFTLLFLLYSNSAFFRSRMKEFGLLTLLGFSKRQLIQLILAESLCIGIVAMTTGLGLGLLFMKLFFMSVSVVLGLSTPIPFYAGQPVWLQTIAVFGTFFLIVSVASLRGVVRRNIIELVRAGRQPKAVPKFSRWKALLGLVLLGGGYIWACIPNMMTIFLGIIPVTTMVCIGTYLLMREGSIALLDFLHRRQRLFYRPGPFLTISQLIHKIQENYRVLAAVAILVAVILTAVGTIASLFIVFVRDAVDNTPYAIQLVQNQAQEAAKAQAHINAVLRENGVLDVDQLQLTAVSAQLVASKKSVTVVPSSFLRTAPRAQLKSLPHLGANDAVLIIPGTYMMPLSTETVAETLLVGDHSLPVQLLPDVRGPSLNPDGRLDYTLCIADELFATVLAQAPADALLYISLWDTAAWNSKASHAAIAQIRSSYPEYSLVTLAETYRFALQEIGLLLFIGFFVSLVFLAACCSLLYFRLFTEIDDNRHYYRQLQKVGVGQVELKKLTGYQSLIIFFTPFIVGLVHSTFAMQALGTLLSRTVLQFGWAVAVGYLVLYSLSFLVTYTVYWRSLRMGRLAAA